MLLRSSLGLAVAPRGTLADERALVSLCEWMLEWMGAPRVGESDRVEIGMVGRHRPVTGGGQQGA